MKMDTAAAGIGAEPLPGPANVKDKLFLIEDRE